MVATREEKDWDDRVHAHCNKQIDDLRAEAAALKKERDLLEQVSGEVCDKCGWAMIIPGSGFGCYKCNADTLKAERDAAIERLAANSGWAENQEIADLKEQLQTLTEEIAARRTNQMELGREVGNLRVQLQSVDNDRDAIMDCNKSLSEENAKWRKAHEEIRTKLKEQLETARKDAFEDAAKIADCSITISNDGEHSVRANKMCARIARAIRARAEEEK